MNDDFSFLFLSPDEKEKIKRLLMLAKTHGK